MATVRRGKANAEADADSANAQAATGTAATADQATGTQQVRSSGYEGTHKYATDVNVEESTAALSIVRPQMSHHAQQHLDTVIAQDLQARLAAEREYLADQRAIKLRMLTDSNSTAKLGDDRMWNLNEDSQFAAMIAAITASVVKAVQSGS